MSINDSTFLCINSSFPGYIQLSTHPLHIYLYFVQIFYVSLSEHTHLLSLSIFNLQTENARKVPRIRKKKEPTPPKQKKKKLTVEEKMQALVQILRNMRKTVEPPPCETVSTNSARESEGHLDKVLQSFFVLFISICVVLLY